MLDSADLRVVSSNTNQNREAKGPGVLLMSPGSPREDTVTFLFEMSLVENVALRPTAKRNQANPRVDTAELPTKDMDPT